MSEAAHEKPKQVLEHLLELMGFEAKVEVFPDEDDGLLLHVETADAARLIGRNAQVLEALQLVLSRMLPRLVEEAPRCVVDVERYRERKKDRLLQKALEAADEVHQTGRAVELPAMGSADRRIIHQALKDHPDVSTYSVEEGVPGQKRVVVCPREEAEEPGASDEGEADVDEPAGP